MDLQLHGKRALITGSSSGIGEEIAKTLAHEGATVVIHGRNQERANRVAEEIKQNGGQAFVAIGDLSKDEEAKQVAESAVSAMAGVDILVNNAGGSEEAKGWLDTSTENWAATYNQNTIAAVRLIKLLVPRMKEQGFGRIIQIASGVATQPAVNFPDYAAAKAAMVNLTVSLTKELAETGITVNTVSPGTILTTGLERAVRQIAQQRGWGTTDWSEIEKRTVQEVFTNPTGRMGRVEDIATFVMAGFINGANLRVDGGNIASIN